jgi:ABC-type histidine transport system ATPase subunit
MLFMVSLMKIQRRQLPHIETVLKKFGTVSIVNGIALVVRKRSITSILCGNCTTPCRGITSTSELLPSVLVLRKPRHTLRMFCGLQMLQP